MPSAGDFYVNLGVKGSEKTVGAITETKKGMSELASMSIEAKAAIVGALYGFEQLMSASANLGTHLLNTGTYLGMPLKVIQQYDWAAQQVGVANSDIEGSFKSLQTVMSNLRMNKGVPEYTGMISKTLGRGNFDLERAKTDTLYLFNKLGEAVRSYKGDPALMNEWIKSFHLSEGAIIAMRRNAFRTDILAKAPTYSDNEVKKLDDSRRAWANLGTTIEMAFGRFNAKHGEQLVNDLSKLITPITHLAEALDKLASKLHLFDFLAKTVGLMGAGTDIFTAGVEAATNSNPDAGTKKGIGGLLGEAPHAGLSTKKGESMAESLLRGLIEKTVGPAPKGVAVSNHVNQQNTFINEPNHSAAQKTFAGAAKAHNTQNSKAHRTLGANTRIN